MRPSLETRAGPFSGLRYNVTVLSGWLTFFKDRLRLWDSCNSKFILGVGPYIHVLTDGKLTASQAMITATFSLVQQIVNMKSLPP